MLGNFKPFKKELNKTLLEQYNTLYCSVCKCIYKRYGTIATSCNSYDLVFIVLCLYNLNNIVIEKEDKERCPVNFLKKVNVCNIKNADNIADFSIFIFYLLYKDKIVDNEKTFKTSLMNLLFKKSFKILEKTKLFEQYCNKVDDVFKQEKQATTIEEKIKIFSNLIFEISQKIFKEQDNNLNFSFYYNMISIMYYLDFLQDYKTDIKNKKENPLKEFAEQGIDIFKFTQYKITENIKNIKKQFSNENEILTNILDISIVRKLFVLQGVVK